MNEEEIILTHIVPADFSDAVRLSDYCAGKFDGLLTRSSVRKALAREEILVDGAIGTTGRWVQAGWVIQWRRKLVAPRRIFKADVKVLFEDDFMAVVLKPAGIVVSGNRFRTLENALPGVLNKSLEKDALLLPLAVHRLDSDTAGLVIVAKTATSHLLLSQQMANGSVSKIYHALVAGTPENEGVFDASIDGKPAVTLYRLLKTYGSLITGSMSLVEIKLLTGRTHQIRKHFSEAGFPVLGDKLYSPSGLLLKHRGLFLFASEIAFNHPVTRVKTAVKSTLPNKFFKFPRVQQELFLKYHES
ncbi:RluA family pseudouridine synthase [Geofilum sp. OHC36d9]|uniref:RluA family pseudouridine synthase n=1 Tax=Geofilum sp. OHC36d9 TaxID=3458413 RepID=UPI004033CC39